MGGNILTKEIFVELVIKEQERKKESGLKLEKIDDTSFYNLLTDVLLEMGEGSKKETPKSTEVKETKKKTKKVQKIEITKVVEDVKTKVIDNVTKVKKEKAIEPVFKTKDVVTKNGLIQLAFDFGI